MSLRSLSSALDTALLLLGRGFSVVPVPPRKKAPVLAAWQKLRLSAADLPVHMNAQDNLGILLGAPSGGLVDVDLDSSEALQAAQELLPATGMIHGRPSKPKSHWWYLANPWPATKKFADIDGTMIVELRSTGLQTIIPPSVHPLRERLVWDAEDAPARLPREQLREVVAEVAACALLARHWPCQGMRQEAALAAAGLLLRTGRSAERTKQIIGLAARIAEDPEWQKRVEAVEYTAAKAASAGAVTGAPTLQTILTDGIRVVPLLRKWLKGTVFTSANDSFLPTLDASNLDLPVIAGQALAALAAANQPPYLFRFAGRPVRAVEAEGEDLALQPLQAEDLRFELARCARWVKPTSNGERRTAIPPMHVVRDMLANPDIKLPRLRRVIQVPMFAADGQLIIDPGFDPGSGTLYRPSPGLVVPTVEESPDRDRVSGAVDLLLREVLGDFPFAADADRANALGCMVLPFVRELISGATPLHLIEKPQPGTGATLLVDVLAEVLGRSAVVTITEARDQDEWRKRVTSALAQAPELVVIDNLRSTLDSAALSSAITARIWKDRILGESRIISSPVRCGWVATGNNPCLSNEMARRSVRIRLDARTDRPWRREGFRHPDLRGYVGRTRGEIIAALLTLVRGWQQAGSPPGNHKLGMFEEWAEVVGGILAVADVTGFLGSQDSLYEAADTETAAWRIFLNRWWDKHQATSVGVRDLWPLIDEPDPVDLLLGSGSERALKTKLGRRIQQWRDRRTGEFIVVNAGKVHNAQLWRLDRVSPTVVMASAAPAVPPVVVPPTIPGPPTSWDDIFPAAVVQRVTGELAQVAAAGPPAMEALAAPPDGGEHGERGERGEPAPALHDSVASLHGSTGSDSLVASVPFVITGATRRRLHTLGFSETQIDSMTPQEALDRLGYGVLEGS